MKTARIITALTCTLTLAGCSSGGNLEEPSEAAVEQTSNAVTTAASESSKSEDEWDELTQIQKDRLVDEWVRDSLGLRDSDEYSDAKEKEGNPPEARFICTGSRYGEFTIIIDSCMGGYLNSSHNRMNQLTEWSDGLANFFVQKFKENPPEWAEHVNLVRIEEASDFQREYSLRGGEVK